MGRAIVVRLAAMGQGPLLCAGKHSAWPLACGSHCLGDRCAGEQLTIRAPDLAAHLVRVPTCVTRYPQQRTA